MKEHNENGVKCVWDKNHSGQKNYRDSAAVWFTVKAMNKIQAKFGITEETTNQNKATIMLGRLAGITFTAEDFDRNKTAIESPQAVVPQTAQIPQMAVADTSIPIEPKLVEWIKTNYPTYTKELRAALETCNPKNVVDAHIKAAYPLAFK